MSGHNNVYYFHFCESNNIRLYSIGYDIGGGLHRLDGPAHISADYKNKAILVKWLILYHSSREIILLAKKTISGFNSNFEIEAVLLENNTEYFNSLLSKEEWDEFQKNVKIFKMKEILNK
jgi:hypothetical protein